MDYRASRQIIARCVLGFAITSTGGRSAVADAQQVVVAGSPTHQLTRIAVSVDNAPLSAVLQIIAREAGLIPAYDAATIPAQRRVTLHLRDVLVSDAFREALRGTGLVAQIPVEGQVIIVEGTDTVVATGSVTGRVEDANTGRPIRGAAVSVDDATRSVQTGEDGVFRISGLTAGSHHVDVRILGYTRQRQPVTVTDNEVATVNFRIEPSASVLNQVVVTGTVVPTELKAVPNAITVITAKQIEERGITRIDQLFRGDVPGLFAANVGSHALVDEVTMFSRGATALSEQSVGGLGADAPLTNPIKTYVDGIELADPKYLSQIDPRSIERIEILTGPQASTIYGSNAINGVMQIFTKRGNTSTPELTLALLSGWVENNFSDARTPQHDYSGSLSGVEGRLSYNAGGGWNYIGPWTPARQTARTNGFGGARLDLSTPVGRVTADVTIRRSITRNWDRGNQYQTWTNYGANGWYNYSTSTTAGNSGTLASILTGQTLGVAVTYAPLNWWSHELGWGNDASDLENRKTVRGYTGTWDTTLFMYQSHDAKPSLHYATTAHVPLASLGQATITAGVDAQQSLVSAVIVSPQTLTGQLSGYTSITRQPDHNTGGFLQMQWGIDDRLFFTYGLRAEWNPGYGAEAQPNYAPKYGVVYAQEFGPITAKLRGSYGRTTRPPQTGWRTAQKILDVNPNASSLTVDYGNFDIYFANPELTPERQQGAEGGVELYLGTHVSLVVTRYNQTVNDLIDHPEVDSTRSLVPNPANYWTHLDANGYGYWPQFQYLNIGTIRNQGWELQESLNLGPFSTRGTYSWTKSRTIGVNSRYRAQFANRPQYQPGATFQYLPEHTWALGITYGKAASSVAINLTGTGRVTNVNDATYLRSFSREIRLTQNRLNIAVADNYPSPYVNFNKDYAVADLVASHHFASQVEGVLQVQNLTDHYTNDYDVSMATMGRQVKVGARIRTR